MRALGEGPWSASIWAKLAAERSNAAPICSTEISRRMSRIFALKWVSITWCRQLIRICRSQARIPVRCSRGTWRNRRVRRQHGVLHQVRRIHPPPQPAVQLRGRQDRQVVAIELQNLTQGLGVSATGLLEQRWTGTSAEGSRRSRCCSWRSTYS